MTNATARSQMVVLFESTASDTNARIDEERGIIFGVKVLGFQSRATGRTIGLDPQDFGEAVDRPYRYAREAVVEAAPLYEHCRVYLDHPEFSYRPDGERIASMRDRKVEEVFGELVNLRVMESGLYADLHYVRSHPRAAQIIETAKRFPHLLALSHNAKGDPVLENQQVVIKHISDVRSVDLVGERPGTTHGLFETARQDMADKLGAPEPPVVGKTVEQVTDAKHPGDTALHEDDPAMAPTEAGSAPVMEDAADGDPGAPAGAPADHFDAAFIKEITDIAQSGGSAAEKGAKIKALLKKQEEINGIRGSSDDGDEPAMDAGADLDETDPEPEPDADDKGKKTPESAPDDDKDPDDKKPVPESAPKVVRVTPNKSKIFTELLESIVCPCIDMMNSRAVPITSAALSAVCRTPAKRRANLVESLADPAPRTPPAKPRSQAGAVGVMETSPAAAGRPSAAKPQVAAKPKLLEKSSDELFEMFGPNKGRR